MNSKKIPECRLPAELDDFYLEKIARADTEGWKPVMTLMHQFSEMFDSYDFNTLGSKIAKYVDMVSTLLLKENPEINLQINLKMYRGVLLELVILFY